MQVDRDGYTEAVSVPGIARDVIDEAVRLAVEGGSLWLQTGQASLYREPAPEELLTPESVLRPPPAAIPATDVLPAVLPKAWSDGKATAADFAAALSRKRGQPLPWTIVHGAIDGAFKAGYIKPAVDSGPWPVDRAGAGKVTFQLIEDNAPPATTANDSGIEASGKAAYHREAHLEVDEIQNLADEVADLVSVAAEYEIRFRVRIEAGSTGRDVPDDVVARLNEILGRVSEKFNPNSGAGF